GARRVTPYPQGSNRAGTVDARRVVARDRGDRSGGSKSGSRPGHAAAQQAHANRADENRGGEIHHRHAHHHGAPTVANTGNCTGAPHGWRGPTSDLCGTRLPMSREGEAVPVPPAAFVPGLGARHSRHSGRPDGWSAAKPKKSPSTGWGHVSRTVRGVGETRGTARLRGQPRCPGLVPDFFRFFLLMGNQLNSLIKKRAAGGPATARANFFCP